MTMGRDFIAEARKIGPKLAERAAATDREGSFVSESYALLAERGFVGMAVPASYPVIPS